tara:strand:+ start:7678 stop:8649 length:972 start_codon:yes stop_codon:yes gene_type:complete
LKIQLITVLNYSANIDLLFEKVLKALKTNIIYKKKIKVSFGHLIKLAIAGYTRRLEIDFASQKRKKAIFAHDSIGRHINLFGGYENDELAILFDFLSPLGEDFKKGLALDIGANIGTHAMYFSDYFKEVLAFEPNSDVFYLLKFNSNQCQNVSVENIGLGDKAGDFVLQEVTGNMMASWISEEPPDVSKKTYSIKVERLDDKNLESIKLIKIDVEGFEINVLKGALKSIEKNKPIILFEQHSKDFSNDSSPSIKFLENLDYEICWLDGGRVLSHSWFAQGLGAIKAFFFGYDSRIVFGGNVPVRTHSFLLAIPKESSLLKNYI